LRYDITTFSILKIRAWVDLFHKRVGEIFVDKYLEFVGGRDVKMSFVISQSSSRGQESINKNKNKNDPCYCKHLFARHLFQLTAQKRIKVFNDDYTNNTPVNAKQKACPALKIILQIEILPGHRAKYELLN
jgi:hypothetical protein